jgi:hypothetical protein
VIIPQGKTCDKIAVFALETSIYFANVFLKHLAKAPLHSEAYKDI